MAEKERGRARRVRVACKEEATARETAQAVPVREGGAPRPQHCRSYARKRLAAAMPELTAALIEQATGGSLGHAKLLLQLSGLDRPETAVPVRRRRGKSLAQELLEGWEARTGDVPDGAEDDEGEATR